jgi:uncharacterized membrane protein YphA (DoxX/SURF4 family)
MKIILAISRIIVGILFIFSGLVKANDPLGLSYKMQEFFEVWNMHWMNDFTLALSVIMIAFEIVAGVAVLVGWQMRLFSWLLLLLILFFTFLTGYALFSGKIRECGCFGDCIPLTADQSFLKDLILLALIGLIFLNRNKIKPFLNVRNSIVILFFSTIFSVAFMWHVLVHLPVMDCLPYKIGNNIPEKMRMPAGAIPDSTVISFVYNKEGKEVEFTASEFPEDFNDSLYKFVKRYDKVVRKGNAMPPIKDFSLTTVYGNDTTLQLLLHNREQLYLFLKNDYETGKWTEELEAIMQLAGQKNIEGYIVTNIPIDVLRQNPPKSFTMMNPLICDGVAIKTAARTNPMLMRVKAGTIMDKWSSADFEEAFKKIAQLPPNTPYAPIMQPPAEAQADTTIKQ